MSNRCIVWCSFGVKYVDQSAMSAKSYRRHTQCVDLILVTDSQPYSQDKLDSFDEVIRITFDSVFDSLYLGNRRLESSKIYLLQKSVDYLSRYKAVLYVDSDTYCYSDISDIWVSLLPNFDLALCKSPQVSWQKIAGSNKIGPKRIEAVVSPELRINAGVLLFRGSSICETLNKWSHRFQYLSSKFPDSGNYSINDQGCLRELIEECQLHCEFIDPRIYNATPFIFYPLELQGRLGDISIGHSHKIYELKLFNPNDLMKTPGIMNWPYSPEILQPN